MIKIDIKSKISGFYQFYIFLIILETYNIITIIIILKNT